MSKLTVGLFNDSFPPVIDGVAMSVLNYAKSIQKNLGRAVVVTPHYPGFKDDYPFKVVRYSSVDGGKNIGYRIGNPLSPFCFNRVAKEKLDIIHVHSPFTAALFARMIRQYKKIPIVFTYHTKFDIDLEKRVGLAQIKNASVKLILNNINACDEVWVVSEGAGENLRSLGYTGEYRVMENGTDFVRGRSHPDRVAKLREHYNVGDEPVFLFVGRMMWYKNTKFTLDALAEAKRAGMRFKMFWVGEGVDRSEMIDYAQAQGIGDECIFTGAIRDRELLREYFTMADLFLFPSTYDTNGLVVREAAACDCPSLVIEGSCASEGLKHMQNGILIPEKVEDYVKTLLHAAEHRGDLRLIGERAGREIYLSWDDAVRKAYQRYEEIVEEQRYKRKK